MGIFILVEIFIFVLCAVLFGVLFFLLKKRKEEHIKFLLENSVTIKKLLEINNKYKFFEEINSFDEEHVYDNEIYYEMISCEDYLIYQLQFNKFDVEKEIKKIKNNLENYKSYSQEILQIDTFGKFDQINDKLNQKYLLKLEKKYFNKNNKNPIVNFDIKIILYCSKINGEIYRKKKQVFSIEEISTLIKRLNNKNRDFYNDKDIWDSLCRVERGKVSNKMRFSIYKRDGYMCCICGRTERSDFLEIDHIKPIAKGGKSTYDNLQTLCRRCNKRKGDSY